MPCRRLNWCRLNLCANIPRELAEAEREALMLRYGAMHDAVKKAIFEGDQVWEKEQNRPASEGVMTSEPASPAYQFAAAPAHTRGA